MPRGIYKRKSLTENHKRNISENSPKFWLGKKMSKEARKKMSVADKGKHNSPKTEFKKGGKMAGKNHWNYKGGINPINDTIRKSIEFRLWRESVFARDNWTCQKYGIRGVKLHSHHIRNFAEYPESRFAIDNGITFSEKAHREFHKKYGIKNNTREQIEEFIKGGAK